VQTRFGNRTQAGAALGDELASRDLTDPVVLGLARGGVVVAAAAARRLGADLDVLVVRKLGHPRAREVGLGALAEDGERDAFVDEKIIAARLNEYVRDKLERGERLPDGIDFYAQRPISISRKPT